MPAGKSQAQAVYPDGTPIPNEKLAEAIQNGTAGYMPGSVVTVTNKAGKRYDVPAERVPEAFKAGWRPEAPSETHVRDVDAYERAHPVETAFRSADEAFNSPDARAAFSAGVLEGDMPGTPLWDAHQAAKRLLPTGISPADLKTWQASRSGYGKAVEELKTTHPTASTLGQAAPLAAQMVGGGPGEAVLRLGEGAVAESSPKLAAFLGGTYATSTLGKAGQTAARLGFQGGFETSAYKAGQEAQQLALSDKDVTSERLLASVGEVAESGVIGTGLGVILGSLGSLSKSGFTGVSKKLSSEDLALKSFYGPTAKQMERMGKIADQGLATTPEQLAAIENDIALTKAYEQTSSGSSKLTDIEKQIEGKHIVNQTLLEVPGAVNFLKSVGERATLVSKAAEAAGKEEGDFIKALDQVAKPDVNEFKLAMRQYAQDLIDHGTGEDIAAGRRLIRNYIDRINGLTIDGRKVGQEVNSFEDMFNFRKDRLRWTETSGVSKNYINELNRVAEGAIEAQIAKVGATAELVPGKGWVISPGGPYAAPRLNNIREILGGGAEVEGLAGGGGVAANANAGAGDAYTAYRGLKDRYARLMAAKLTADRGARLEATAKHGLTDILSIGTGIAEATSHGLGTGLVSGLGMKAAAAVLSPARRNALLATTMRAIQGGTDTTALKLSGAVKAAVKAKTVAADTVKRLPAATSKIISRYVDSSDSAREANANPAATTAKIAQAVSPVMEIDPNVGRAVTNKLTGDMQWLSQKIATGEFQLSPLTYQNAPGLVAATTGGKKGQKKAALAAAARIPTQAMAKLSRYERDLWNPLGAIQKYSKTGRLSPELPEVLSERRPQLQAQLQAEYVDHINALARQGQRQDYAGRIGATLITGMVFDSSMESGPTGGIAVYQSIWQAGAAGQPDQSSQGPAPSGMRGGHVSDRIRDNARDRASAGEKAERDPGE